MSKVLTILIGIILLATLGYFCIYHYSDVIQEDIQTRSSDLLLKGEFKDIKVIVDGRDITLSGNIASEKLKAIASNKAKNIYGVRAVNNQLIITAAKQVEDKLQAETIEETISTPQHTQTQNPKVEPLPTFTCQQDFDFLFSINNINFASNSANIDPKSHELLNNLTEIAKQCPDEQIEIAGHTDSDGDTDYNLQLSQKRATAVMAYLVNQGISASRLTAVGYGESKPRADNLTDENMAKNRRIEFKVKRTQP